ncbi:MAG: LemA family protein [Candidatus Niyogibacteria bacterium]|nr:LemA family protein [Candidatus Niyogibacteria bacterium]
MQILWFAIGIIGLAVLWAVYAYNRFVTLRFRSHEALSDIDVQLKRRFDLIPNLIEAVKGYMEHEKSVLENVTRARTEAMGASGSALDHADKDNMLTSALKSLFAVSENYPDLKANTNFVELQRELADTENKIQAARRFYNSTVMALNTMVDSFPANFIASMFKFMKEKFFQIDSAAEREPVKVKF